MATPPIAPYQQSYGSLAAVGVAKEVTFGVAVTPTGAGAFLPMTGCTIDVTPGLFHPPVMQGQRDLQIYGLYGQYKVAGAITGPLFPSMGVPIIVAAIGTDTKTGTVAPYTHTISQANRLHSLTVDKILGITGTKTYVTQQFRGCMVNKLALKCQATNSAVTLTADVMGQAYASKTVAPTVTITTENPFVFAEATLKWHTVTIATVEQLSITITNGVKETYTLNASHYLQYLTPVALKVNGTFDMVFDNLNNATYGLYTKFMLTPHATAALTVTWKHPATTGLTSTHSVQVTLPQVRLSKIGIAPKMETVIMETVSYEAEYNHTAGHTIQAVVHNAVATAY